MNKLCLLIFIFISSPLFAQNTDVPAETPALVYKAPDLRNFDPRESHWLTSFGFEGLKYPVPFNFTGARQTFSPKDQELWGGRFGYGKEFYIGKGFNAVTKVEGYYLGTLFAKRETADPNIEDVDVSYTKTTGQIWGFEASQSIGYLFDMKTKNPMLDEWSYLTVEPFIEAGIGWATAYNRVDYNYDSGTIQETYKEAVEDQLLNARFGAGVNFTSSEGVFLYLKASLNQYDITKRKTKGLGQPDNQGTTGLDGSEKNVDIDPIIIYALGGGYKF